MTGEFYIGYGDKSPPGLTRFTRLVVLVLVALVVAVAVLAAVRQRPLDSGRFEYGRVRGFEGVLYEAPLPLLRVRTGDSAAPAVANLLLVGAGKCGLPAFARGHGGQKVRFNGSLIYRGNMTMVELNDAGSFQVLGEPAAHERRGRTEDLGAVTLTGELVDTKCYFGVMRPATGKVHRACAIRCLSGGVPPGLLLRDADGNGVVLLLAGTEGRALDLDPQLAARTLTVDGRLEVLDGTPVLRVTRWALKTD